MSQTVDVSADEDDRCSAVEFDVLSAGDFRSLEPAPPVEDSVDFGLRVAVHVDLLGPDDWQDLRSARLAALNDAPEAFVASLDEERRRTFEDWIENIARSTWAAAWRADEVVGIARLTVTGRDLPLHEYFIESVWVNSKYREKGLVRRMLHSLEKEARAAGAESLQLWVLEDNISAYDAYLKLSFYEVPEREQDSDKLRDDGKAVRERLMIKPLL